MVYELYAYLDYIARQSVPFTASDEYLEAWANLKGVYRRDASSATGTVMFTGIAQTFIPAGTVISRDDSYQYTLDNDWQIDSTVPCTFTAVTAGSDGNADAGIALTLNSPITGVNSVGASVGPITGGADQEDNDTFRARMLTVYANPPNGGSASDFVDWALEVPGVTRAWVVPQGIGAGSVLIYVMLDNANTPYQGFPQGTNGGSQYETRIPAATGDQLTIADHIYNLRPVTSIVQVSAPTPSPINFTLQSLSPATQAVEAAIITSLSDMFTRLASPVAGNAIYPSDVNAAIEAAAGVIRYTLVSPVAPITVPPGQLAVLGQATFI